ncbi:hypothetical protein IVB55_09915 [Bradyrhizobium sp. CW4]|uniref:hypothetical protein n=1 Tax=Bradyrhizobium sp. CW4 TaxID=2782687 RepID=UPI001FF7EE03|nr:hypothetical protein [Bradyrhizobium sp. CW4]MCK1413295.1 hypothetical protein [Bradyrhizobium sp. CW4]
MDNAKSVAHMPTAEQQQTKKDFKPRFKVDPAASPMPETKQPNSQTAKQPNSQTAKQPNSQTARQPERLAPRATSNRNGGRDHLGILGEIKLEYPGEIIGVGTR